MGQNLSRLILSVHQKHLRQQNDSSRVTGVFPIQKSKQALDKCLIVSIENKGLTKSYRHAAQANSANNKLRAQDELRKTNLEWTSIHIGFFLDFWGSSKSAAKSNLHTPSTFVDIKHRAAAIPGSGDVPVTFTYSRDVAKFVAALLNLEKWEEATYIIGDKVTFNEMVKIAEEATGA
jgi:hypothetical protein